MPSSPDSPHSFDLELGACMRHCSGVSRYCMCAQEVVPLLLHDGSNSEGMNGNKKDVFHLHFITFDTSLNWKQEMTAKHYNVNLKSH